MTSAPTDAELLEALRTGSAIRRGGDEPAKDGGNWGPERCLGARKLRELLTAPDGAESSRAVVLVGLRVTGRLDLEASAVRVPLLAHNCFFDNPINLDSATASRICLSACEIPGIAADGLRMSDDLDLRDSTIGVVAVENAHIGGSLLLDGVSLTGAEHPIDLGDGTLRPPGSPVSPAEATALAAYGLRVGGSLVGAAGFSAVGATSLVGAHITGHLAIDGATFNGPVNGHGLVVERDLFWTNSSQDGGQVQLIGARVAGTLQLDGSTFSGDLDASELRVGRSMLCQRGFRVGQLRLAGAQIAGVLSLRGPQTHVRSLSAEGLQVGRDMRCDDGFVCSPGGVLVAGGHIAGQLTFINATIGYGLDASRLRVDGDLILWFSAPPRGVVRLSDAQLGALIDCETTWAPRMRLGGCVYGAVWTDTGADETVLAAALRAAIRAAGKRVAAFKAVVAARSVRGHEHGPAGVTADKRLKATIEVSTPESVTASMRGFAQGRLAAPLRALGVRSQVPDAARPGESDGPSQRGLLFTRPIGPPAVRQRLSWIAHAESGPIEPPKARRRRRVPPAPPPAESAGNSPIVPPAPPPAEGAGYSPQPYTQLMAYYRREGRDRDARLVAYRREVGRARELPRLSRAWNTFLRWTVGYGYKPLRALALLAVLVVAGSLVFSSAHGAGDLRAVDDHHPPFHATIYTLDRLIPVVSFGLREAFAPSGSAQWWAFAYTLLGWTLSVAVIAGLNAAVRRD